MGRTGPVASSAGSVSESWNLSGARPPCLKLDDLVCSAGGRSSEGAEWQRHRGAGSQEGGPIGSAAPAYPHCFLSSAAFRACLGQEVAGHSWM